MFGFLICGGKRKGNGKLGNENEGHNQNFLSAW